MAKARSIVALHGFSATAPALLIHTDVANAENAGAVFCLPPASMQSWIQAFTAGMTSYLDSIPKRKTDLAATNSKMAYHSPFKIKTAVRHLKDGSVIAYPTEAVYGLGCDPLNETAVMALLDIKQRPIEKGLILIASSLEQLRPYLVLDQTIIDRITPTWPGPVTWVIPAQPWVPKWLRGEHQSLAVRVTNHPIARDLCAQFGSPLVSTSANPTTRPAIKESRKLLKTFADTDIFIVHGKVGELAQETAIYDALSGKRLR